MIDDTLPAGLAVVSAAGAGWECGVNPAANSLHCQRSDALAPGSAYAPVSVIVNVLESAPDSLINTGVTGGGGETNTANNRDDDSGDGRPRSPMWRSSSRSCRPRRRPASRSRTRWS